jgi:nucleotide-binding universal stress UspA family protein
MVSLKRILIATDFGEAAEAALAYGRELARTFGATIDVLTVADNVLAHSFATEGFIASYPELQREVDEAAKKSLAALVTDEDRRELGARPIVVTATSPALAIVEYARSNGIDLIIMGTHGRGPMAHLIMGSVAERVVRTAPCPVMTVRHPEREFLRPDALVAVAAARR